MILLDTHVLIWFLAGHSALPQTVKERIEETGQLFVSAASIWELGIKGRIKGKEVYLRGKAINSREAAGQLISECEAQGIRLLGITPEACAAAPFFPGEHKDPFDRIIAAQSLVPERLTLISADTAFDSFGPDITRYWPTGATPAPVQRAKKKPKKASS